MTSSSGMSGCCGSCYWFMPDEEDMEWGECVVNPPMPLADEDGVVVGVWPSVELTHHHCGRYIKVHNDN